MRIGIFGGSFDPVHYGHLLLAESARECCQLDEVWFVPAANPPHKQGNEIARADHRVAMLQLAIGGNEALRVSCIELERGGISYTVQTLRDISNQRPEDELFFLMGADSLADLPGWREPAEICQLATPIVVRRAGSPEPSFAVLQDLVGEDRVTAIAAAQFEMPVVELSSTDLRVRAAEGRSLRYRTPRAVEAYIAEQHLYRTG